MSYDIALLRPRDGEALEDAFTRLVSLAPADDPNPGPVVAAAEAAKQSLADALVRQRSSLRPFQFDFGQIAAREQVERSEARRRWRHIELNDEDLGLQITLHDEYASATLPYWHEGAQADAAFRALWGCLQVIRNGGAYSVYDPQLGRALDLASDADFAEILKTYVSTKRAVERARRAGPFKKPWWKFW
jgi:hypothetical protein